jgi:hypothetical protein
MLNQCPLYLRKGTANANMAPMRCPTKPPSACLPLFLPPLEYDSKTRLLKWFPSFHVQKCHSYKANMPLRFAVTCLLCFLLLPGLAQADEPTITVTAGNDTRSFTRGELLARPDATTIEVARDVTYRVPMTYRAAAVASLLAGLTLPSDSVIEAVALDGFIAQLPSDLVFNSEESKAVAWLAIEPADHPWPPIPGKDVSAGPFYMVWTGAEVGSVRSEQWPYHVAKLVSQPSPASRWPALAVNSALPSTDPVRAGQALFVVQCLPCHKLNGAGASGVPGR